MWNRARSPCKPGIIQNLPVIVPELNGTPISHLEWADDIVLLARDKKSLQILIEIWNHTVRTGDLKSVSATIPRAKQQS